MQVRDATVGVDHRQRRAVPVGGLDRREDRGALGLGHLVERRQEDRHPVVGVDAGGGELGAVLGEERPGRRSRTAWPKMIGSETFIIVALRCTE